jgi:hypothetical protein
MSNYHIRVTADSVDVECDGPFPARAGRISFASLMLACATFLLYGSLVGLGRQPAIWATLANSRSGSTDFFVNLCFAVFTVAIVIFFFASGIRYFLPFGERLHCDRSTLTWSKIPWISLGNRWVTRSISLSEISRASYSIVYRSKGVYGILLETSGKPWKMFWQLESPEANRILRGLKALGVNVCRDPEMRESIRETLRDRRAQL